MAREIGASAGLLGNLPERAFVDVEGVAVADADGVNECVCLLRAFNRIMHLHAAAGIDTVREQYDRPACVLRGSTNQLLGRGPNGVPDRSRSSEGLIGARYRLSSIHHHSTADVT